MECSFFGLTQRKNQRKVKAVEKTPRPEVRFEVGGKQFLDFRISRAGTFVPRFPPSCESELRVFSGVFSKAGKTPVAPLIRFATRGEEGFFAPKPGPDIFAKRRARQKNELRMRVVRELGIDVSALEALFFAAFFWRVAKRKQIQFDWDALRVQNAQDIGSRNLQVAFEGCTYRY